MPATRRLTRRTHWALALLFAGLFLTAYPPTGHAAAAHRGAGFAAPSHLPRRVAPHIDHSACAPASVAAPTLELGYYEPHVATIVRLFARVLPTGAPRPPPRT